MPRWKTSYPITASLELDSDHATYTHGDEPTQRYTTAALHADGALARTLIAALGFEAQIEAQAWLLEDALPPEERITLREDILLEGRPRVPRYFSDNLGRGASTYNVWIFGRKLIIDVRGQPRVEITLREFLATGFTAASAALIGEGAPAILSAVAQLAPLPCFCDTGAETPDQHGSIKVLLREQHPQAPIEHVVTVGRCAVCGRGWTFIRSGDSHYSFDHQVSAFPPR